MLKIQVFYLYLSNIYYSNKGFWIKKVCHNKNMDEPKNDIQKLFGNNVQKYRKKAGLTQDKLSEEIGITQKHLSIIETGKQFASVQVIEKISQVLGVPPSALFGEDMNITHINNLYLMITQYFDRRFEELYARLHEDFSKYI